MRDEAIQLKGLKKFLLHFSAMSERKYFEVHVWEAYLIYAQLLGIADKVEEQFSKLCPDFYEQSRLNIATTAVAVSSMAYAGYKGYQKGQRSSWFSTSSSSNSGSRDYSGSSRDSGGDGRSYSSGGGSAGRTSGGGFR